MNYVNEYQDLIDKLLKEQETRLTKEFSEKEKRLTDQHEQLAKEWASFFEIKTESVAKGVAEHIGREVVNMFTKNFGQDSEVTKLAKGFPYAEQAQVAVQLMGVDGQAMTGAEFSAKNTTTWDDFNAMGGLSAQPVTHDQVSEAIPHVNTHKEVSDSISAMRTTEPTQVATETAKSVLRVKPFLDSSTTAKAPKQTQETDLQVSASITTEMLAATQESSSVFKDADKKADDFKKIQNSVGKVISYKTISPLDERLSIATLEKEMSTEKHNVHGKSEVLINYFDKTRHFDFGGKTAEEFRANCIDKKDYKQWLNTFQPGLERMTEQQKSEKNLMPFDATDKEIKQMSLKHKTEVAFYETSAKLETSKAEKLFPHEFYTNSNKRLEVGPPPTKNDVSKLLDTFKDYAAHKLGLTWKTEFEKETPIESKKRILDAKLSSYVQPKDVRSRAEIGNQIRKISLSL